MELESAYCHSLTKHTYPVTSIEPIRLMRYGLEWIRLCEMGFYRMAAISSIMHRMVQHQLAKLSHHKWRFSCLWYLPTSTTFSTTVSRRQKMMTQASVSSMIYPIFSIINRNLFDKLINTIKNINDSYVIIAKWNYLYVLIAKWNKFPIQTDGWVPQWPFEFVQNHHIPKKQGHIHSKLSHSPASASIHLLCTRCLPIDLVDRWPITFPVVLTESIRLKYFVFCDGNIGRLKQTTVI